MKVKIYTLLLICLFTSLFTQAQMQIESFIRTYNRSLVLSVGEERTASVNVSFYGDVVLSHSLQEANHYRFQGQEYDSDLGIYHFPSRFYSVKEARFMSPDPKSQYFSPYSFVGGDPVNVVDFDGKEGKALVLYFENFDEAEGMGTSMKDFKNQVKDAYYSPLSDFINGDIGELPEWNGNVFIKGHLSAIEGEEIAVERGSSSAQLRTRSPLANHYDEAFDGKYLVDMDAKKFGKSLREFSERRGVPVRNIVAGGCQGHTAAERIGKGFQDGGSKSAGIELRTAGLKDGKNAFIAGKLETEGRRGASIQGLSETRYHVKPKGAKTTRQTTKIPDGKSKFVKYKGRMPDGSVQDYKYAGGAELEELANGRIPASVADEFEVFRFTY